MRTVQIPFGELIEAIYEDLIESYGDKEVALVAAQAVGNDLLNDAVAKRVPATRRTRRA